MNYLSLYLRFFSKCSDSFQCCIHFGTFKIGKDKAVAMTFSGDGSSVFVISSIHGDAVSPWLLTLLCGHYPSLSMPSFSQDQ